MVAVVEHIILQAVGIVHKTDVVKSPFFHWYVNAYRISGKIIVVIVVVIELVT